jgi:hypothetical protein
VRAVLTLQLRSIYAPKLQCIYSTRCRCAPGLQRICSARCRYAAETLTVTPYAAVALQRLRHLLLSWSVNAARTADTLLRLRLLHLTLHLRVDAAHATVALQKPGLIEVVTWSIACCCHVTSLSVWILEAKLDGKFILFLQLYGFITFWGILCLWKYVWCILDCIEHIFLALQI